MRQAIERLSAEVEAAAKGRNSWEEGLSAGLRAGLELLATDPVLARGLFVDPPPIPGKPAYECGMTELVDALRPLIASAGDGEPVDEMRLRLVAGGLISYVSGRVLAGEAESLPEAHRALLRYLLAFSGSPD